MKKSRHVKYRNLSFHVFKINLLVLLTVMASVSYGQSSPPTKPAWLTDLSVGVKESYDDNVFESGLGRPPSSSYTVTPGSVAALKNISSFITTVSPKVGVNFAPLLGDPKTLQALTLNYAPDFVTFNHAPSENFSANRLASMVKWQDDDLSFNLSEAFTDINGSKFGPTYPGDLFNVYATAADRERRKQTQDRASLSIKYDQEKWFLRPTATLLDYDLSTAQYLYDGYQNYVNRYDANGGMDLGYKVDPQFALTLGYRYGYQYQAEYSFGAADASLLPIVTAHSPSHYQRVLIGFEGKPFEWLSAAFQIGPDFRSFDSSTPISNTDPVKLYGEGIFTATVSSKDTVTFKYKQWEWVSSTGLVPYFDSTFDLNYCRRVTNAFSLSLGARALDANYNPNNIVKQSPDLLGERLIRNDWLYTGSLGLQYAFNANFSANLAYSYDLGVDAQSLAGPSSLTYNPRSFNHQQVSLGGTVKF
jgi:hypothetical protein